MHQTFDGGYILGGFSYSDSSKQKSENSNGLYDYWIVKTDPLGAIQWDRTFGSNSGDRFVGLQQTTDSGFIITGTSDGNISGDKTENSKGGSDFWVLKISAKGKIQWDKTIGGNNEDMSTTIKQTSDGGFIIGGYSLSGITGDKTESNRELDDFWVVKLSKKHLIEWDKTIGGADRDQSTCLLEIAKDNYLIGGWTASNKSFDKTDSLKTLGHSHYWLVNFTYKKPHTMLAETGKENNVLLKDRFIIYPNPTKDYLHIKSEKSTTVLLLNSEGKILLRQKINQYENLDLSHLSSRVYFLKTDLSGHIQKMVVQK